MLRAESLVAERAGGALQPAVGGGVVAERRRVFASDGNGGAGSSSFVTFRGTL